MLITAHWKTQPWFTTTLGLLEDYPRLLPRDRDLVLLMSEQEFIMKQGIMELIAWPISGNPLHHKGISLDATDLLLSSWRTKTKSNYNFLFAKWVDWCKQRDKNSIAGPVKDIVNFLAEQKYKYRYLNSYHSVTSSVHAKVDDYSVGQQPLVVQMLKGVFNERLPLPRYSTFWDVGVVIRYLKQLGSNSLLSLCSLTIKAMTLLALSRPSRPMDLCKLDI